MRHSRVFLAIEQASAHSMHVFRILNLRSQFQAEVVEQQMDLVLIQDRAKFQRELGWQMRRPQMSPRT